MAAALTLGAPGASFGQGASPEVTRIKTAYLADLADVAHKFGALAEAFPAASYGWRPMPGVRSVSQVLGLVAGEMYFDVTPALGGAVPTDVKPLDASKLEALTDRAALIAHVKRSYELARQVITKWNGAADAPIHFWGENRTPVGLFAALMADQHEHLGQLIAYARANHIVPPWSK
jgi:hypothetical protein